MGVGVPAAEGGFGTALQAKPSSSDDPFMGQGYPPMTYLPPPGVSPSYDSAQQHPPYGVAPPAAAAYNYYQNTQQQHYPPAYDDNKAADSRCDNFARGIIMGVVFIVLTSCMMSLFRWVAVRPQSPVFHISNMTVTDFNVSSKRAVSGTWDVRLAVRNPSAGMNVTLQHMSSSLGYGNLYLSYGAAGPLRLEKDREEGTLQATFPSTTVEPEPEPERRSEELEALLANLEKARGEGVVKVSLKMDFWGRFVGGWADRDVAIRVVCQNMAVVFPAGPGGNGSLQPGWPSDCLVWL